MEENTRHTAMVERAAKPVVVDSDVAPDDWVALLLLLQRADAEVRSVTVAGTGEVHPGPGVRNARRLAALVGRSDVPIAAGRAQPLQGKHRFPLLMRWMMDSLLLLGIPAAPRAASQQTAVQLLTSTIQGSPDKVTMIALGGLTNIAELFLAHPGLVSQVEMLYIMGGAVDMPGNIREIVPSSPNEFAEWNIYVDPHAAAVALDSGVPITLVPLDATNQNPVTVEFAQRLEADRGTPATDFVCRVLRRLQRLMGTRPFFLWDPMTVCVALDNSLGRFEERTLKIVEDEGPQCGRILDVPGGRRVRVCQHIDRERFEQTVLDSLNGRR